MHDLMNTLQGFEFRNAFWYLILPLVLMSFDVLTGFLNAWLKHEVKWWNSWYLLSISSEMRLK